MGTGLGASRLALTRIMRPQDRLPKVPRVCLRCRRTFGSWGVGNRICDRCSQIDTAEFRAGIRVMPSRVV